MFYSRVVIFGTSLNISQLTSLYNLKLWLSGLGMVGLKSAKVFHSLMTTRQALLHSTASRLLGFEHSSTQLRYSYSSKAKAHIITKVG